ncbi:hypothetical protein BKA65DRAFT_221174 [Rhexocercosporidium sp. MPI-PUGE-AT-0058]|nr:hypothetical protein BKA65DRAFT_221174 [Rhexocercosporidium sp. MPI-PUGE-AT-0058]
MATQQPPPLSYVDGQFKQTGATPTCASCLEPFDYSGWALSYRLNRHASDTGHLAWACTTQGCQKQFSTDRERDAHQKRPHVAGHGRVDTLTPNDCIECGLATSSKADLLRHAKELQHQPYACLCGSSFSRTDVLNRHLEKYDTDDPKHPCKYCKRHRGANGFRRLDHLMQHIRNYHHHELDHDPSNGPDKSRLKYNFPTCPHSGCSDFRDALFKQQPRKVQQAGKPFASQAAFTKHMRDVHNESTFPCNVAGCERVGRRGYFREKDLLKHRRDQHPAASSYQMSKRDLKIQCTEEGCHALLDPSSMNYHLYLHQSRFDHSQPANSAHGNPGVIHPADVTNFVAGEMDLVQRPEPES